VADITHFGYKYPKNLNTDKLHITLFHYYFNNDLNKSACEKYVQIKWVALTTTIQCERLITFKLQ